MSRFLPYPVLTLFLGLGCILLALCGLITWTTRISFRLGKVTPPKIEVSGCYCISPGAVGSLDCICSQIDQG